MRLRYNALTLERRLAEIGRDGHFQMPRRALQSSEIADLAAFMETVTKP